MSQSFPPQHQNVHPGKESLMNPLPVYENANYVASGKLAGKTAIVTGGDSGIGRAISLLFAKEGADVAIVYLNEESDAAETKAAVENCGRQCLQIRADLKSEGGAAAVVRETIGAFGKLDVLVNNAAAQYPRDSLLDIDKDQLVHTFESNIFSYFFMTKAALPHLKSGASIINTASVTAFEGNATLIDYSATKGAIVTFTRSMSESLLPSGIRVNCVAPGPIWTPLIVSSFSPQKVEQFGTDVPMGRAGQPYEVAPAFVFLASSDASYISGQVIHVNGGKVVN